MFVVEKNNTKDIKKNNNSLLNKKRKLPSSTKSGKEYYTLYKDIDKQMKVAQDAYEFQDKVVLCNCDNPLESNFFFIFC